MMGWGSLQREWERAKAGARQFASDVAASAASGADQILRETVNALPGGEIVGAATDFLTQYTNMRYGSNVVGQDKYFHCMANCQATQRGPVGRATARVISDAREANDAARKGDGPEAVEADQRANRTGREGGATGQPCRQVCEIHRPQGLSPRF